MNCKYYFEKHGENYVIPLIFSSQISKILFDDAFSISYLLRVIYTKLGLMKKKLSQSISSPVVILCNGEFPRHPTPLHILKHAGTLICTDGATDYALRAGLNPNVVIGDLDSLDTELERIQGKIIQNDDQNSTDLEKAIVWCVENKVHMVIVLGATGNREDHTLANFQIITQYSPSIHITLVTDHFTIEYVEGTREFESQPGQKISILPFRETTNITTVGLKFELKNETLEFGSRGISNESLSKLFSVTVKKGGAFVFLSHTS